MRPACVGHLRGERALPDQVVERQLVAVQLALQLLRRPERVTGGANRLVCLLCVLHLARVLARRFRDRVGAVELDRLLARCGERRLGQRRRVGAHVGDVAVLVQALGDAHRRLRSEAQLAARLLLQRRGHERRGGPARVRLLVGRADRERDALELRGELARRRLVETGEVSGLERAVLGEVAALNDALSVQRCEPSLEGTGVEQPFDVPVLGGHEGSPLALPLDDEPDGHRLHAPGRESLHDLLPEHRRDFVAVEPVEDAPRLLGVDEPLVDLACLAERPLDCVARDLVEDHPADGHLRLQLLEQMPGDRLALAVFVCCEQELVDVLELALQVGDDALLVGVDDVVRLEVLLDRDAEGAVLAAHLLRNVRRAVREVADVADARLDQKAVAEVARDGLRLRGALDDNELLRVLCAG